MTPTERRSPLKRKHDRADFESRLTDVERDCFAYDKWCKDTNGDIKDIKTDGRETGSELNQRILDLRADFNRLRDSLGENYTKLRDNMDTYFAQAHRESQATWLGIGVLIITVLFDIFKNYV